MALNNVIRRTASQFVPFAVRVIGGSRRYNHRGTSLFAAVNSSSGLTRKLFQQSLPSTIRRFSSRPSSDESLIRVLESEIDCASEDASHEVDVPGNFPFKIQDNPGLQTVTLTREYQGETISVEVHMSSLITGEENDEDGNEEDNGSPSQLPLVVRVSKKDGPVLEFDCTAYPDEISIESLSVKDPDSSEDEIAYEGPNFEDLDENLQKAFHKYLEIRGIKPSTTNFLHEYMINKDGKEYMNWLKNLKKFIEA
ncbi:hypothetical protein M9H77_10962 [Catharanthus roseus]|uniref:Uncharacterized protein n=1 Tax=Catharanthus roseus TaxID=4058 RepID=A0ACC0BDG1_CATRO|nr:hypothetical protein M9H77_10962 [Catharanthus roseus]